MSEGKLITTYFSNAKNVPEGVVKIGVSLRVPQMRESGIIHDRSLAPSERLLRQYKYNQLPWDFYEIIFAEEMKEMEYSLVDYLKDLRNGTNFTFICYEKDNAFCHRRLLAEWFVERGIEWKEL